MLKKGHGVALLYKDANALQKLNFSDYLANRDECVVAFLEGSFGIAFDMERVVAEAIYFLCNLNVILSYSFLSNLIPSLVSGSKLSQVVPIQSYNHGWKSKVKSPWKLYLEIKFHFLITSKNI